MSRNNEKPKKEKSLSLSDAAAFRIAIGSLLAISILASSKPKKDLSPQSLASPPPEFVDTRPAEVVAKHSFTPEGNIIVEFPTKHGTAHIPMPEFTNYELDLKQYPTQAEMDAGERGYSTDTYTTLNKQVYSTHPVGTSLVVSSTPIRPHAK